MKISILGAGDFGTALGSILAEKGWDIDYGTGVAMICGVL